MERKVLTSAPLRWPNFEEENESDFLEEITSRSEVVLFRFKQGPEISLTQLAKQSGGLEKSSFRLSPDSDGWDLRVDVDKIHIHSEIRKHTSFAVFAPKALPFITPHAFTKDHLLMSFVSNSLINKGMWNQIIELLSSLLLLLDIFTGKEDVSETARKFVVIGISCMKEQTRTHLTSDFWLRFEFIRTIERFDESSFPIRVQKVDKGLLASFESLKPSRILSHPFYNALHTSCWRAWSKCWGRNRKGIEGVPTSPEPAPEFEEEMWRSLRSWGRETETWGTNRTNALVERRSSPVPRVWGSNRCILRMFGLCRTDRRHCSIESIVDPLDSEEERWTSSQEASAESWTREDEVKR